MDDHHPENFIVTDNIDAYASSNHLNARHVLALLYKTDKLKWILLPRSLYKINSSRINANKSDEKSAWLPLVTAKNEKFCLHYTTNNTVVYTK